MGVLKHTMATLIFVHVIIHAYIIGCGLDYYINCNCAYAAYVMHTCSLNICPKFLMWESYNSGADSIVI